MSPDKLLVTKNNTLLLVVDIQERLCPTMDAGWLKSVIANLGLISLYAQLEGLPVILTEQYPQGLGPTHADVLKHLSAIKYQKYEKDAFSCAKDALILEALRKHQDKQIILTGMETHICIYLTALGLLEHGFNVMVPHDAVITRTKHNHKNGLHLMREAGAVVTNSETLIFQMMERSKGETFKSISRYIKSQK
ncbi:MAG: isochorismatase family protein [Deltaproteobacteria bacterium]|nr:isochorismatase family protein [Deltaproteobacteria bacterium]